MMRWMVGVVAASLLLLIGVMVGEVLPNRFVGANQIQDGYGRHGIVIVSEPMIPTFAVTTSSSPVSTTSGPTGTIKFNAGPAVRNTVAMIDNWEEFCPLEHKKPQAPK